MIWDEENPIVDGESENEDSGELGVPDDYALIPENAG